jgi:carboxyl-terminal processing protease
MTRRSDFIRQSIRRTAMRVSALVVCTFLLASCATVPQASREYTSNNGQRVFAKAYENVFDKYIEALDTSNFAYQGIIGLNDIDPKWSAERAGENLRISLAGAEIDRFQVAKADDIDGWAKLTTRIIETGRAHSDALKSAAAETIYKAVLNHALSPLDRHSRYAGLRSARDYRAKREGFGGIGVRLNFDHGMPQIISVLPESPAAQSPLMAGDIITKVEGKSLEGLERRAVIWRLRGEVGTNLVLAISRKEQTSPLAVTLKRALIVWPTVTLKREKGVAVIAITGFNQHTARNLNRILIKLNATKSNRPKGIVLDMRGNPGGLLDQAVAVADSFLGRGRIVSTRGRHPDSFQLFNAAGRDLANRLPLAILINGQSASAAEIVAAALQDHGRAVVIGSNSYGKGTVQNITRLPNDGELILTWSRFHAPSGYAIENIGVMPNFCTLPTDGATTISIATLGMRASESAITLPAWRAHSGYDKKSAKELRQRCPRRSEAPASDIDVAAQVLANPRLYAQALGASRPALARSKGQGAEAR